jgi:hypothetical protein
MVLHRVRENDVLMGELTLKPNEGEVLPETYLFKRGKTRDELVAEMVEAQSKLLEELWTARGSNVAVKSAREAVILASIVEKETGVAEERPRVAAVFSNRLKKNMKLQSDPTIIYGIAGGKGKLDRPLSKADIADKTAYNTYQITGLPPGPIANPGRQAIEAALNPAPSTALYFVADGTGGHAFAETLAEHNANVQKWRGIESNGNIIDAEPETPAVQPKDAAAAGQQPVVQPQLPDMNSVTAQDRQKNTLPVPEGIAKEVTATPDKAAPVAADGAANGSPPVIAEPQVPDTTASVQPKPAPSAEANTKDAGESRKPGDVLKVSNRLVPIPVPKPKRP